MHSLSRQSTLPQNKNATPAGVAFFRCRPMMGSNTSEGDAPIVGQLAARGAKKQRPPRADAVKEVAGQTSHVV